MKHTLALLLVALPACSGQIDSKPGETGEVGKGLTDPHGADIAIDQQRLRQSISVVANATVSTAEVQEGCAQSTTGRTLIRFDVKTPNFGPADLVFGHVTCKSTDTTPACLNVDCSVNPDCCCNGHNTCTASAHPSLRGGFECSCAYRHIHFERLAQYRLLNSRGEVAATGHKQSFCL